MPGLQPAWRAFGRAVLREGGVALLFLCLAALATRPLAGDLRGRTLAGPDPVIDLWTLHWLSGHLLDPGQLFEGNIFYPARHAAVYSDLSLGTAVLVAPLRAFVEDPVPLYNLGVLAALAFGAWAFCCLVRGLTGSASAGLLAGVLAAFGSHQLYHVYHLNLLTTGWLALLLLGMHRIAAGGGMRWAVLAGVSFALAAQSSGYYAVAAALLALAFAAAHWRRLLGPRALRATAVAAALGLLLTLPYARVFLEVRAQQGLRRPPRLSERMAFQPGRDLTSHGYLYRGLLGSAGERLFPGLLAPVLGLLALRRRAPGSRFYACAAGLLLLVSLGPRLELLGASLPLPYGVLFALPPLDAMRHPYSFAAVASFLLAVLAGIGWASLRPRAWAGAAVVAAAVLETLAPPVAVREVPQGVPPAYRLLESLPPGPVLELPVFDEDALLWAARHGRPVLNGIGAFLPRDTQALESAVENQWLGPALGDVDDSRPGELLRESPVRYLIVPTGRTPRLARLAAALSRSPSYRLLAETEDGARIFELTRSGAVARSEGPDGGMTPTSLAAIVGGPSIAKDLVCGPRRETLRSAMDTSS
jgi:hypothetical protein